MREAISFLLLACACGAATLNGRSGAPRWDEEAFDASSAGGASSDGARGDGSKPLAGPTQALARDDHRFDALEQRAAALAHGMHQVAERESGGERVELVRAAARDTCVRVAFEAKRPIAARLLDADGGLLAETDAATEGALGDQGPVCIRRGDSVSAVAAGDGAAVKWIAWATP